MNVFDIIGPVMIGPSSSHTAGAARIGRIVRELLGEQPVNAVIRLHGSFAKTYKGHGTDRAIIGGLLGMLPDDENIRDSMKLAALQGLDYCFKTIELKDVHPNTVLIDVTGRSGKRATVLGSSVGGGNIIIKNINGLNVEVTAQYETLIVPHKDAPGTVAAVTNVLAQNNINIAQMKVYRSNRGGDAIMVIETDQIIPHELVIMLEKLPCVNDVTVINPI